MPKLPQELTAKIDDVKAITPSSRRWAMVIANETYYAVDLRERDENRMLSGDPLSPYPSIRRRPE